MTYTFNKAAALDRLASEIRASSIVPTLNYIQIVGTAIDIDFAEPLSESEQVYLSEIVEAHEAIPLPESEFLFTDIERAKLSGIEEGATANDTDANLKARANHTGTQLSETISDFFSSVLVTTLSGLSLVTGTILEADTILEAFGKIKSKFISIDSTLIELSEKVIEQAFAKEKVVIQDSSTFTGVVLPHRAVENSVHVHLSRLMLIEGEDYIVEALGEQTRVTLIGSVAYNGIEGIEDGDTIIVNYAKYM
jgi:hypothetical protein